MASTDSTQTLGDYLALLRRRKKYLLTILPAAVFASAILAFGLPASYRATATILIEQSSVAESKIASTMVSTTQDTEIELVRRRALSATALKALVSRIDPYPEEPALSVADKARMVSQDTSVEKVDPITYKPLIDGNAFSIYYDNPNPMRASLIAAELARVFLEFNRKTRTEAAEQTYQFLAMKLQQVDSAIRDADQKIADFKKRFGAALPEDQLRNQSSMSRAQAELDDVEGRIRLAQQREADLSLQLSQLSPTLVGAVLDTRNDLAALKAQLAEAEQRYKPDHPDVKRLRRAVQDLLAKRPAAPGGARPDNPEYLRTASGLQSVRQELAALREIAGRAQSERQTLQVQLTMAPSVEKDYSQLIRNHEVLQGQFQQLQARLQEADISRSYESEQQGQRFTLIRAPTAPDSPNSPNRLGLILMGFVLGGALAAGFAVFAETSDPTVRSYRDVREATEIAILGAIPQLLNAADRRGRRRMFLAAAAAFIVAIALVSATIWRSERIARAEVATIQSEGKES